MSDETDPIAVGSDRVATTGGILWCVLGALQMSGRVRRVAAAVFHPFLSPTSRKLGIVMFIVGVGLPALCCVVGLLVYR